MSNGILIVLLAAVFGAAVVFTVRRAKKGGGCCGEHESVSSVKVHDRSKAHYPYEAELVLGGMTCENCARKVENALNAQDGVWAKVRFPDKRAVVRLKEEPEEGRLRQVVADSGYVLMEYHRVR